MEGAAHRPHPIPPPVAPYDLTWDMSQAARGWPGAGASPAIHRGGAGYFFLVIMT
jgi:hypothetical protein